MKGIKKSDCWEWFSKHGGGYGQIIRNKKCYQAHRWMYENFIGKIPEGCELDHLCRNRACVNPRHLEPVIHAENCRRGICVKLKKRYVDEIRIMAKKHSQRELAKIFGVSHTSIWAIVNKKKWK